MDEKQKWKKQEERNLPSVYNSMENRAEGFSFLAFELAKIIDGIFVDLGPLFREKVKELVLHVPLDHDLVVSSHRGSAGELGPEEFGCHFQVDL